MNRTAVNTAPQMTPLPRQVGFTLLEVLVAVAVTGTLSLALYGSLAVAFHAQEAGQRAVAPAQAMDAAFAIIRDDLHAAMRPNTGQLAGELIGQVQAGQAEMQLRTAAGISEIELSSANAPRGVSQSFDQTPQRIGSDIVGITYQWLATNSQPTTQTTSGATGRLVRVVQRNLLAPVQDQGDVQILCDQVVDFQVRYYTGEAWQDTWDSAFEQTPLPIAIEVAMEVAVDALDPAENTLVTRRWTRLYTLPQARHTGQNTVR